MFGNKATIGDLYVNSRYFCHTLEDVVRGDGIKIPGETAIPYGRYKVIIDFSNRFQKDMPHVLDVPMFQGIRIHSGNTDKHTEGCILLGISIENDGFIGNSKVAFSNFFSLLRDGLKQGEVWIEVTKED
jgi:hypothetical protein